MKLTKRFAVALVAALSLAALSALAFAGNLELRPDSKLWLEGKSTIHEFKSTASTLKATFEENKALWPADAQGGVAVDRFIRAKGVGSIEVVIPVAGMRSGKDGLDKNMKKALLEPKHPEIRFKMSSYEIIPGATEAEMTVAAKGTLTVAGVEREIALPVKAVRDGEVVHLRGSTPLLMTQFGIKPPTMMMGTMRTADQVMVHFDLAVGAAKDSTAGAAKVE